MADQRKPAYHGSWSHRDGHEDQISGAWFPVLTAGADPPDDPEAVEGEDYLYLMNDVEQPTAGSGPGGGDVTEFSFRRGISLLDFRGHLDVNNASSPAIALIIPPAYLPPTDSFDTTVVYDGTTPIAAMWYLDSTTGELTLTWPLS